MTFRLVQRGHGPLVVCYLVGPGLDAELVAALPGATIVATPESVGTLAFARELAGAGPDTPLVLVGYSRGCQAVRGLLVSGAEPMAVVTIDGTHASKPPDAWQLQVWRELAAQARRLDRTWVATCCLQRYVETQQAPYLATSTVLAQVLDLPALAALKPSSKPLSAYPGAPVLEWHEGSIHFRAYGSTNCDHDAHLAQGQEVLPATLREYIAPLYGPPAWQDPALSYADRCVEWSLAQLGVTERPPGSNTGPEVRAWLEPCERDGRRLGLTAADWCAAFACAASRAALLAGQLAPHGYVASGIELQRWAASTGRWVSTPERGDLAIYKRGGQEWQRHVCRVVSIAGEAFTTVGGNEEHRVKLTDRRLDDATLLGFCRIAEVGAGWQLLDDPERARLDGLVAQALDEIARALVFGQY